ncbi:hypothetical protein M1834_008936 [Neofusicoccum parvum]|uniref:Uncharacterized protein n=1 Tax=Neofusicoccum parvum TaxID=310453 RepID=A0ACB5SCS1_9PEZI|nr:hypothetical protein M1834_008936 [Neofusicoccum parvum]GME64544.1 hypothetical protein M1834_008936 [Neofusicoccum parvum]
MALNATMRGVVWEGNPFSMVVADLPVPTLEAGTDAVVRVSSSAICGTDLHTYRGIFGGSNVPYSMGHEAVGYISEIGDAVSHLTVGDHVIIADFPDSGHLEMGPEPLEGYGLGDLFGDLGGCQAEYVRVPFADDSLIPIPEASNTTNAPHPNEIDYLFVSDIFGTGWGAIDFSGFEPGDSVAVFGAGPVGLLAAYSAIIRGASTVYVVDHVQARLDKAASIGAIPINFVESDPVAQILAREPDGVQRSVDCVGFEALNADLEIQQNIIVNQMVAVTASGGGIGQVGVTTTVPESAGAPLANTMSPNITFPSSDFFIKGLGFRTGAVDVKKLAPQLVELIASGKAKPSFVVSKEIGIEEAPEYYDLFEKKKETKVVIRFP